MKYFLFAFALAGAVPAIAQADRAVLASALQPLVEAGNPEAAYHLGMMRSLGIGTEKDLATAFALFQQSADAGDPLAAYKLGDYYARGLPDIVAQDSELALKWKRVAAEAGYALAQHDVARMVFDSGDIEGALEWLTRAAGQGNADALRALASLYNSDALPKDGARTFAYYTLFLRRIAAPTQKQLDFLTQFASKMTAEDRKQGNKIITDWKTEPSAITKRAQAGLSAIEALLASLAVAQLPETSPAAPK